MKKFLSGFAVLLVLSSTVLFVLLSFSLALSVEASSVDDWAVYRHDAARTGFSSSKAPTSEIVQLWGHVIDDDGSGLTTPVVANGCVYVVSSDHGIICFRASDGTELWRFKTGAEMCHVPIVVDGQEYVRLAEMCSSPVVADGHVYVSLDNGYVYCLNASSGNQVWNSSLEVSYCPFTSLESSLNFAGGRLYCSFTSLESSLNVQFSKSNLYCLDAASGEKLWKFSTGADSYYSEPAISADGYVFVTTGDGDVFCLDAISGEHVWDVTVGSGLGSAAAVDGFVYFGSGDGNVYCLNASSGAKIWNYTTWYNSEGPAHGYYWGNSVTAPAVAYGHVYVGSTNFDVFCLDALTGKKIWDFSTGGIVRAPSVAGGCVFVGSADGNIYCLNASSGVEIWRRAAGVRSPIGSGAPGSPVVCDGVVYVIGNGAVTAWGSASSTVSIVSPENKTYTVNNVSLTFTVSWSTSWMGYSLDSQANVTITGNTTLTGLSDGSHSLIVYAKDAAGNTVASEIICFSIEPFPTTWIAAATVIIAICGAALLVYFTKVKKTTEKPE